MTEFDQLKKSVKILISEGRTDSAIQLLLEHVTDKKFRNGLLLLRSEQNRVSRYHADGRIDYNQYNTSENIIRSRLLSLLDQYTHSQSHLVRILDYNENSKIKELIGEGKIELVLNILISAVSKVENRELVDDLMNISHRYSRMNSQSIRGLLTIDELQNDSNKLAAALLTIIDTYKDDIPFIDYASNRALENEGVEKDSQIMKLIIVGEPGSGKTSLMRKLIDENYRVPQQEKKDEESTVGINVFEGWQFQVGDKKFKANIWDFGGQEIQYMTHQFFLTPQSLYVLVADNRKQYTNFQYWFEVIHLLGNENGIQSPILVVLNENNHCSISDFDIRVYRKKYINTEIRSVELDLSINNDLFKNARTTIQNMLANLPHVQKNTSVNWLNVYNDVVDLRKTKKHIKNKEFVNICNKNGVKEVKLASQYLHNLGLILHFRDDIYLKDFIILDVKWALEAVYSILKDKTIKEKFGKFTISDVEKYWKNYSHEEQLNLLNLMTKDKFEICYRTSDPSVYVAPQLLKNIRPKYSIKSSECIRFRFYYRFMPKGILTRAIVKKNEFIGGNGRFVWQTGVVFTYKKCDIEIEENQSKNYIDIKVSGPEFERKYALQWIRDTIDEIHKSWFSNVDVTPQIRCDCDKCSKVSAPEFFDYEVLLRFLEKREKTIVCNQSVTHRSVLALIEGVYSRSEIQRDKEIYYSRGEDGAPNTNRSQNSPKAIYFYLISLVVILTGLSIVFYFFDMYKASIVVIFTIIIVVLIALFQLKNDSLLREKNFAELIKIFFGAKR